MRSSTTKVPSRSSWTSLRKCWICSAAKAASAIQHTNAALNNAAVSRIQQARVDEARELLRSALALDADYPYAHYNLGLIQKNRGDFEEAAKHFEAVVAFSKKVPRCMSRLP